MRCGKGDKEVDIFSGLVWLKMACILVFFLNSFTWK